MEFGIALFRPTPTDGCQNNTIRNCVVTLNKVNTGTFGIYGAASTAALATSVAATSTAGANSGNKVNGNILTNAATGLYFTASTTTTVANYDQNNEVGVTAANQVYNFGTTATGWGIGGNYQNGFRVLNNVVNNTLDYVGGTTVAVAASTVTSTLRGIYGNTGTSANIDIIGNVVTLASGATTSLLSGIDNGIGSTAANNTVNISGNTVQLTYATATTATITGITNSASAATVNITGNTVQNSTAAAATTGSFTGITGTSGTSTGNLLNISNNRVLNNVASGTGTMTLIAATVVSAATPVTINNNVVTGNSKTPSGTTLGVSLFGITLGSATTTITGNTVTNNSIVTSGTSTSAGTLTGINSTALSTPSEMLSNNTITGLSISGTSTATTHILRGILTSASSTSVQTVSQNVVGSLAIASGSGTVLGISVPTGGGPNTAVTRNKIYSLSAAGAAGTVSGLLISAGGTYLVANNLIGSLTTPTATGLAAVSGIQIAGGSLYNVTFNTVRLDGTSSGTTFGTQGVYLNSTTAGLNLFNNIVVNLSTPVGTGGVTAAVRRISGTAGTVPANLFGNNNLYYAGTPSATNLIYVEGTTTQTNAQQTLADYKAFMINREANSVTETTTPFASTAGTDANFLHLTPGAATQAESGGQPFGGVATDFDGDIRNTSTPDIGADEGSFLLTDVTGPIITLGTLSGSAGSTTSRSLTVTITDPSGVATGAGAPRLYFRKGTGAYVAAAPPTVSGSTYTFTFDYALVGGVVAGDAISYYVAAQDALGNLNTNPTGGTGTTPPGTTPPPFAYGFTILGTLSGTYYVSATAGTSPVPARTYATLTAAVAAYNTSGLGGAVTFLLLDPTYSTAETFPISVLNNPDASATNTLTIKPSNATGTTAFAITGSNATAILQLLASDYVTLDGSLDNTISTTDPRPSRDLTVSNTNTGTSSAVIRQFAQFTNDGATFNTIKNLAAVGVSTTATAATLYGIQLAGVSNATTAGQYTNNTVQNCAVRGTQVGIASLGGALTLKNENTVITQNDLNAAAGAGNLTRNGILLNFDNNAQVTLNAIGNIVNSSDVSGISLGFGIGNFANSIFTGSEVSNALVSRNTVGLINSTGTFAAVGIGAASSATGTTTIVNNFVSGVASNGTGSDFAAGIYVNGTAGGGTTRVLYNSVSMSGNNPGTSAASQPNFALAIGGTSPTVEVRNNAFYNNLTVTGAQSYAVGFAYAGTTGNYAGLTSSNNAFFGTNGIGLTGSLGSGTVRATLADLNTETGQDRPNTATGPAGTSLTLSGSPFVSATNLHAATTPAGLALNGAGTPIAGTTIDFDNEVRNASTPDIGADEFLANLDVSVAGLTAPVANSTCFGTTEAVTASITNASAATLDFAANPVTVTVTITPTAAGGTPQTFTTTVNTGTLAAGASQAVTFTGTADLSALGTYTATVTTALVGDDNTANNSLSPAVTITSSSRSAAFTYPTATICAGATGTVAATLGTGATAGTFASTTGLTIDATTGAITPGTSTAGTYAVTNTLPATATCPATVVTQPVTITPATSAAFNYGSGTFCVSGSNPTATVTGTAGGTFSTTAGLTIDAATGAITLSGSTPGTYVVTYSVAGSCPSSSTQSVTITNAPAATFSYGPTPTFCVSGATAPAPSFGTGASGGVFSSTAGLTIDAATGVITLSSSTPGTYTVTNSIVASGGCAATSATTQVTITAAPVAAFSYGTTSTYCVSGTANPTVALGTGATAGTFSSTTGLTVNATTGAITLSSSTPGTYTVTNSIAAASGCAAVTATAQVTITAAPVATFSYATATGCAGSTGSATPTLGAGASAGTFSATTGLVINATTGAINLATSTAGTYTITNTVAASGGCAAATATTTFTVNPRPATPLLTAAYNGTTTTLTSSATTGNQFFLNGVAIAGATGQTYVINGSAAQLGSYTVVVTNANGCASLPSTPLVVTAAKNGIAGTNLRVYPNPTPTGEVTLELTGFRLPTQLTVLDALGRVVATELLPASAGTAIHSLNLTGVATGVYLLRLSNTDGTETRRLVRQ